MFVDLFLIHISLSFYPNRTAYNSNLIANLVYSANGSCVDTTICNGKILMHERKMYGSRLRDEDEILEKSREIFMDLIDR